MLLPRTIKKLLGVFRGKVTPLFVFLSTALGFWFGLMPGFSGLHLTLLAVVLILNVNIGLFIIFGALGKAVCYAAAPVLYYVGLGLHDWLWPLLRLLSSLPIIGITNFDRYALAGGVLIGPIVGAVLGLALVGLVIRFRQKMVALERNSPAFKTWYSKRWVRILDRILIGKRTVDMESMFTVKKKMFRLPGLIIVVMLLVFMLVILPILSDGLIKDHTETAMSWANGAEVNLDRLMLSPATGNVSLSGLQVTDPDNLDNNRLAVGAMTARAGVLNLLKGDFVLRNVELDSVTFDAARQQPGRPFERTRQTEDVPEKPDIELKSLDETIAQAEKLYDWFNTLSKWLPERKPKTAQPKQAPTRYLDYLEAVAASPASPRVLARAIRLEGVALPVAGFGASLITVENANDAPYAARLPIQLDVTSNDGPAALNALWDFSVRDNPPAVSGTFSEINIASFTESVGAIGGLNFSEGVASGQFAGHLNADYIDLTVDVMLSQLAAQGTGGGVFGLGASDTSEIFSSIDQIGLTLRIVGPTARPQVSVDAEQFMAQMQDALTQAGKQQLQRKIQDKLPAGLQDIGGIEDLKEPERVIEGIRSIFNR